MVQPLAALVAFAFLLAGPPPAAATPTLDAADLPAAVAAVAAEPPSGALAGAASLVAPTGIAADALAERPAAPAAAIAGETPSDESGWLIQAPAPAAPPPPDLRRPRLAAAAVPEAPHPAAAPRRDADDGCPLPDLHLVRQTKDRGS
jgi:hypothetical protein